MERYEKAAERNDRISPVDIGALYGGRKSRVWVVWSRISVWVWRWSGIKKAAASFYSIEWGVSVELTQALEWYKQEKGNVEAGNTEKWLS